MIYRIIDFSRDSNDNQIVPVEFDTVVPWNLEVNAPRRHLSEAEELMRETVQNPYYKGDWENGRYKYHIDPAEGTLIVMYGSQTMSVAEYIRFSKDFFSHRTLIFEDDKLKATKEGQVVGILESNPKEVESGLETLRHVGHVMPWLLKKEMYAIPPHPQISTFH